MDEAYSTMTTPTRKRQRLNRLDNTKTFFRRRESQQDTIQDLFKPKQGDGEDAMEKVILKYTNVLPGQDSQMPLRPKLQTQAKLISKIRPVTLTGKSEKGIE